MSSPALKAERSAVPVTKEVISFIERSYWIVGVFTLYWFIRAVAGVYRISEVDFPLIGPCKPSETIIFTLLFLWVPLLALQLLTRAYQRRTAGSFPGVLGDKLEIPSALRGLRWLVFFVLVVFPTGGYLVLTVRAFTHLSIVWKAEVDRNPWDPKRWEHARTGFGLFRFSSPPDGSGKWIFNGDWRWKHQYDEWREELAFHPRIPRSDEVKPEQRYEELANGTWRALTLTPPHYRADGTVTPWIETRSAGTGDPVTLVELQRPPPVILQKNANGSFVPRTLWKPFAWDEPIVEKKVVRVWVSAWPGLQPLLFTAASASLSYLLVQHLVRGWKNSSLPP